MLAEDESLFFLGEDLFAIDDISRYNFVHNCYANRNKNWEKCKSDWISCFPFLKFSKFYRAVQSLSQTDRLNLAETAEIKQIKMGQRSKNVKLNRIITSKLKS